MHRHFGILGVNYKDDRRGQNHEKIMNRKDK